MVLFRAGDQFFVFEGTLHEFGLLQDVREIPCQQFTRLEGNTLEYGETEFYVNPRQIVYWCNLAVDKDAVLPV